MGRGARCPPWGAATPTRSRDRLEVVVARGQAPLGRALDAVDLDHGGMVVFDVRPDQPWEARLWTATHEVDGKRVVVLGA